MSISRKQPHIVLIQTDQMSVRAMPFHGNTVVKAPIMSKLAEAGVVFDSMYCNYPLCAPSRASMLTGRFASSLGCFDNGAELAASIPTVAHHLRSLGYLTCLSGKMHFLGPDQLHGFEERLTTDIYPCDFSWTADWNREATGTGTGEMRVVTEAGPCKRSVQIDFDDEVTFKANRWLSAYARSGEQMPFFLTVSFTHPHDPFSMSTEFWNRYRHEDIDMPSLPRAMDPHSQRIRKHFGMDQGILPEHVRRARHAYYAAISYLDDKIGELMRTLEECGLAEDTIILLTSDHGEFLGERDLWFKRSFFEESVRVPFVVYAPWRWQPRRIGQACSLLDLLPTLVHWAGGADPKDMWGAQTPGHCITALLDGQVQEEHDIFSEVMSEATPVPAFMVRRGEYKYIYCKLDPPQLFNLAEDKLEQCNLAERAECRAIIQRLHEAVASQWDLKTLGSKVRESQLRRKALTAALNRGKAQPWDYAPPVNADTAYYRNRLAFDPTRLFEVALRYGIVNSGDHGYQCGALRLGTSSVDAVHAIAADLDLANAIVRGVEEKKSFLR